jgi:ferritin-like metal-binding protein YciE
MNTLCGVANTLGAVQGMSTAMAKDRMVKDAMASYAIEHFEIASYTAIVTAARDMGHEEIARVCETIITEEQDMADWLEMQLPMVVRQHFLSEVNT